MVDKIEFKRHNFFHSIIFSYTFSNFGNSREIYRKIPGNGNFFFREIPGFPGIFFPGREIGRSIVTLYKKIMFRSECAILPLPLFACKCVFVLWELCRTVFRCRKTFRNAVVLVTFCVVTRDPATKSNQTSGQCTECAA